MKDNGYGIWFFLFLVVLWIGVVFGWYTHDIVHDVTRSSVHAASQTVGVPACPVCMTSMQFVSQNKSLHITAFSPSGEYYLVPVEEKGCDYCASLKCDPR